MWCEKRRLWPSLGLEMLAEKMGASDCLNKLRPCFPRHLSPHPNGGLEERVPFGSCYPSPNRTALDLSPDVFKNGQILSQECACFALALALSQASSSPVAARRPSTLTEMYSPALPPPQYMAPTNSPRELLLSRVRGSELPSGS